MLKETIIIITTALTMMLTGCEDNSKLDKPAEANISEHVEDQKQSDEIKEEASEENTEETTEETTIIVDTKGLSNEKLSWYYNPNDEHIKPTASDKVDLNKYSAYYFGTTDDKIIYLTFDEGYENGYSSKILDVLKEKNVPAAFFVTKSYIESNQDLIKRMVDEGHVVGNHSVRHLSSPDLTDDELRKELTDTADYFKEVTGQNMPKVFRPPMGEYSERTLAVTQGLGYKTIFWSFAHRDWLTDDQPGKDVAYNTA